MTLVLAGALATSVAVICLVLVPLGTRAATWPSIDHPERALLRRAGWTRSMFWWECVRAAVTLCAVMVAGGLGVPPLGMAGAIAPSIVARAAAARRDDARGDDTVAVLQLTLAALRSGASLPEALRLSTRSAAQTVFADAVRAFDLGAPLDVALHGVRARNADRRVTPGVDALSLCVSEQLPASRCATLIAGTVDRLVFERRLRDEVRSRTSGLRAQIVLLAALVPGLALYLCVTVPGVGETLGTPLGRYVLLPAAAALETAGILLSRRIVRDIS